MREVVVLGIGQTVFGKFPDRSALSLGREAVGAAIKDCGIDPREIQVVKTARMLDSTTDSQKIMMGFGVTGIEMMNVENACAGGSTAVHSVWADIASGRFDVGLAIGVESINSRPKSGPLGASEDLEAELGQHMPGLFANLARRQMEVYGATKEDFAEVSAKNHRHAVNNPYAQYRKELSVEEILNSTMIADPITLLQCCPNSDGAAAVILCSVDYAKKYTTTPIKIRGSSLVSGTYDFMQSEITTFDFGMMATEQAYSMAGIAPEDIDVVEIHDAFANEELIRYEDLLICERGEGAKLLRSGATAMGGRVPFNPSGGLLSLGHPLSASGVRVVADIARQLRGESGGTQVEGAKLGVAHMLGGVATGLQGGACSIQVLSR